MIMETILEKSYLIDFIAVEACSFAGGIWLVWDRNLITIEFISQNDQSHNVLIRMDNEWTWVLTIVYASPNPLYRMELWKYLNSMERS